MPRIKVIFNPAADRGDNKENETTLQAMFAQYQQTANGDYQVEWTTTERPGHAVELARDAAKKGYDAVVVIGGDGTVHETVNGIMTAEVEEIPALGILPAGTGNDTAANFGLPSDHAEAVKNFFMEDTRPLDIGYVANGNGRAEYWVNTLGFGFSGAVSDVARRSKTALRGFALYLYIVIKTILFHAQDNDFTAEIDEHDMLERSVSMVNICNGRAEGGGFPVAPDAVMDDGYISYTFMRRMNRLQLLYFLPVVLSEKHTEYPKFFEFGKAERMHIKAKQTLTVHVDGEFFAAPEDGEKEIVATILPSALQVLCGGSIV